MAEVAQMKTPNLEKPEKEKESKSSKKKSRFKFNLIVIVISQLILAGGGFMMVSKFIKPDPAFRQSLEEQQAAADGEEGEPGDEAAADATDGPREIYLIEDVIVNPAGTRGSRYLSVSIGVEMNTAESEDGGGGHGAGSSELSPLDAKKAQLRDGLIGILSSKTILELTTIEEKEKIRGEILEKFSEILNPEPVHQIYFVDFVLQ